MASSDISKNLSLCAFISAGGIDFESGFFFFFLSFLSICYLFVVVFFIFLFFLFFCKLGFGEYLLSYFLAGMLWRLDSEVPLSCGKLM